MSGRRMAVTTLAMGLVALALGALGPDVAALQAAVVHPQRVADTTGPDAVVSDATLVLSELVTNAVIHAATDVHVSVELRDDKECFAANRKARWFGL